MDYIEGSSIHKALTQTYRVYLCGDLKLPQELPWIHDSNNEVGISLYEKYTADAPHFHLRATEYNFIISGRSKVLLLDEQKELILDEGSLFVLPPMTRYASKHQPGTKMLFFKSPGGNDKQLVNVTDELNSWLSSW